MSELQQQLMAEDDSLNNYIIAYSQIPTAILNRESKSSSNVQFEMNEIIKMYNIYKNGAGFTPEGSKGDYVPSDLKYKLARKLIKKECRFLFAKSPDIKIDDKGNKEESNDGNIGVFLKNISDKPILITKGERIAQGAFFNFLVSNNGNTDDERTGGFGSSGK